MMHYNFIANHSPRWLLDRSRGGCSGHRRGANNAENGLNPVIFKVHGSRERMKKANSRETVPAESITGIR
jgi:hypothetical protein